MNLLPILINVRWNEANAIISFHLFVHYSEQNYPNNIDLKFLQKFNFKCATEILDKNYSLDNITSQICSS